MLVQDRDTSQDDCHTGAEAQSVLVQGRCMWHKSTYSVCMTEDASQLIDWLPCRSTTCASACKSNRTHRDVGKHSKCFCMKQDIDTNQMVHMHSECICTTVNGYVYEWHSAYVGTWFIYRYVLISDTYIRYMVSYTLISWFVTLTHYRHNTLSLFTCSPNHPCCNATAIAAL